VAILTARVPVTSEPEPGSQKAPPTDIDALMRAVADGDRDAFADLYDAVASRVYGLVRRVLRDSGLAEEVAQEALVEVWRTAARFDPSRGSAAGWIFTIAHRRAVDRVRAEQATADRERRAATANVPCDDLIEEVTARLEQQAVRRCLRTLTQLQRESILLAYYGGLTYREVADRLGTPLPTVKTRMRDGLIRLRDCLRVSWG
jgi:RNA polymerase sigma-70 factor, ECF subfamily